MLGPAVPRYSQRFSEPRTRLVGRASAISSVLSYLRDSDQSMVTITGPGGVGKTRLALRIASVARERFHDGVIFVLLAPARGEQVVLRGIGRAIALHDVAEMSLFDRLVDDLRSLDVLIVLDNFEHVLAEAVTVDRLMEALPTARVLVTSQARLNLSREQIFALEPLALPPAEG